MLLASTSRNEVNGSLLEINVERFCCTKSNSLQEGRREDLDGDYMIFVEGNDARSNEVARLEGGN